MFWLDQVVDEILQAFPDKNELIIRDEKTLSGRVHVGSLRGVVIHGLVAQALNERGKKARFLFEFNDADPMDGMPIYLDEKKFRPHMGKPLKDVPSPDGKAKDYPTFFGEEFLKVMNKIGFYPEIVRASEQYENGTYDEWIEKALLGKEKIRAIYREVSGSQKPEDWYPLQMICEKCGKVGTTKVTGFDGKEVTYHCMKDLVKWAEGCDYKGKASPFWKNGGRGKLPWKVEWAVKWLGYKVDIEGSGKDHNAAGGSHDVSRRICEEVFEGKTPFNVPYEFFLFEGAKMSSSKGMGATAHEMSEALPPELLRFLLTRTQPQTPINLNADGETIPRLFDEYDKVARVFFGEEEGHDDQKRVFHFSQISEKKPIQHFLPRFSRVAFIVQIPHLDEEKEIEMLKGAPLIKEDREELKMRSTYAKKWLEDYAAESHRFEIAEKEIPEKAAALSGEQKKFLAELASVLEQFEKENKLKGSARGEALHAKIHEYRKKSPLEPREGFAAIYTALIGKDSGPQAGWFLEALEPNFVIQRFRHVAVLKTPEKKVITDLETKYVRIAAAVQEMFSKLPGGVAIIKNVSIKKEHPDLEKLKQEVLASINPKELKKSSPILAEYKAMYKKFGVDPTKRKPSPVALIDRLANGKELPKINTVVDAYNLAAIKHQISCGVFNFDKIAFPVTLRFAEHGEVFQGFGEEKPKPLQKGELIYADTQGFVIAQDYNHRDSEMTGVHETTKNLFVQVDGNAATTPEMIEKALNDACKWITKWSGGEIEEQYFF